MIRVTKLVRYLNCIIIYYDQLYTWFLSIFRRISKIETISNKQRIIVRDT
jgi:hypothetical protein